VVAALVAVLAWIPFPETARIRAGDAAVARTLLETAKKSYNGRKYDEAVALFRKAFDEDNDLIEAVYWIGATHDKRKDDAAALTAYREFLALCDARNSFLDGEPKKLRPAAERRLDVLAAGEKEFRKLEDKAVADLLAFAESRFVRDPSIATEAVKHILMWRPDHAAAASLLEKLGGPAAKSPGSAGPGVVGPFAAVKVWRDLLRDRTITASAITYSDDLMVIDTKGGSKITPSRPVPVGDLFCYEVEFRVAEAYESSWLSGMTFGEAQGQFLSVFLQKGQVALIDAADGRGNRELETRPLKPIEVGEWHRLGVVVRGPSVEVWLDGKALFEKRIEGRENLRGDIGIFQQRCRTERRVFRAGDL
jgi:tetratricopeptide (TPR) repeat protein